MSRFILLNVTFQYLLLNLIYLRCCFFLTRIVGRTSNKKKHISEMKKNIQQNSKQRYEQCENVDEI